MTVIDLESWNRRDHFHFFRKFDEPFFGLTLRVDCTQAYARARRTGESFFLRYLHHILGAVNDVECFRYRIRGDQVVLHDVIHASATINREDGTFDFSYIPYEANYDDFAEGAQTEIERIRKASGLNPGVAGDDVIHFSAVPWLDFTSLSHARQYRFPDSCPKISVGKMTDRGGELGMPLSLHAHHALLDGRDVAVFADRLRERMNE